MEVGKNTRMISQRVIAFTYYAQVLGVLFLAPCLSQSFTKQPSSQLGFKSLQVEFECQVSGIANPSYYWIKDGTNVTRGTQDVKNSISSLTISGLKFTDAGQYACVATGSATLTTSTAATLTVRGSPDITQGPTGTSPHVGQEAIFHCIATATPSPSVSWTNPSNQPINRSGQFMVYGNGSLVISDVKKADAGYYTCIVSNSFGSAKAFAQLTVLDAPAAPSFTTTPTNQTAREGSDITFYCMASGVPTPTITWHKVGGVILSNRTDKPRPGAIRIQSVIPSDDGSYVCEAINSEGTKRADVYLRIEGFPRFTLSPSDVVAPEFSEVKLDCLVAGDPTPSVSWILPSGAIATVTSPASRVQVLANHTLVIGNATESEYGEYVCVAKNSVGEKTRKVTVSILTVPSFNSQLLNISRPIRDNVTIMCPSRGNPSPHHLWTFGGKILSQSRTLSLVSLNVTNQGYYTCHLNNSIGSAELSFFLRVIVPPSIKVPPTNQSVALGATARLDCQADGDPPPLMTWETSQGSVIGQARYTVAANGTLTITMATAGDTGWLTCTATNAAGSTVKKAYLTISDVPVFVQLPSNQTLVKGNAITLPCRATAADAPVITWFKADQSGLLQQLTSSGVSQANGDLSFASVTRQDRGMYACQACNAAGCTMTPRASLNVLYNPLFPVPPPDVGVIQGEDAKLMCAPDSNPPATISWSRPDGTALPGTGYEQVIVGVQPSHVGDYKCSARNEYGSTGEQTIRLTIETRAVVTDFTMETSSTDLVTCDVTGTPAPTVTWYLGNVKLPQNAKYPGYSVTRDDKLRLPIGTLKNNTFYCNASNPHASMRFLAKVPAPPVSVAGSSVTSSSCVVTWSRPSPQYLVTHYELDMWSADDGSWSVLTNSTTDLSYPVLQLSSDTVYRFRVRAVNGLGSSVNSLPSANVTTLSAAPSSPRDTRLTVRNASVIIVTWSAPQEPHGPIGDLKYDVTYLPKNPNATNEFRIAHDPSVRPQEFTLTELAPDTRYSVSVRAGRRRQEDGAELWSEWVKRSATTPQIVPIIRPIDLKMYPNGATQIMLQWKKPPFSISGYYIWYRLTHTAAHKMVDLSDGTADTYVIMDLEPDTQYEVRVQMYSNSGIGPLSLAQVVRTQVDAFSAGYSRKDQGLSWKVAVGGLALGLLLLIIVAGIVWYRRRNSTRHRQSFRISASRNRPTDLLAKRSHRHADHSNVPVSGIQNDALDHDVDFDMFEHGAHSPQPEPRQVKHMDPSQLEFSHQGGEVEAAVSPGDPDVYLESYSPRGEGDYTSVENPIRGHIYNAVENEVHEDPQGNGLQTEEITVGTVNAIPVYSQVDKASKKNRRNKGDTAGESERTPINDVPTDEHPYDDAQVGRDSPKDDDAILNQIDSPRSDNDSIAGEPSHLNDLNHPLSLQVKIPPFPERKNTTASEVSIEFPPPPPLDTLPDEDRQAVEGYSPVDSDVSYPWPPESPVPMKPPRTFEEYPEDGGRSDGPEYEQYRSFEPHPDIGPETEKQPDNGPSSGAYPDDGPFREGLSAQGTNENKDNVPLGDTPEDKVPRKRRMVADWGDDAPMDNLWEQLDKELDLRLGT
ncbi:roundabout homolog 3 [Nematostella vectensis]|uniref:roundabout homolog 3 n=1 Tax=Nematostella vectensis TaxID=45351 RepID=UPI0020776C0B|nr:roundabout homolog 3 [Nematostella vectensis]